MRSLVVRNRNRVAVRWVAGAAFVLFVLLWPTVAIITAATTFAAYTVVDELRALAAASRNSAVS
jgi:hypothetical protein